QVARLYDPFYTTRRGRGGMGLGMHIVYTNVTQVLGGTLECRSRRGHGMTLEMRIPSQAEVARD
ncbi:sensor histidine kinase, partial [bacterium]